MDISYKIDKIQNNFKTLVCLDSKIELEKLKLKGKLNGLKETHTKMSKSNTKQIFLFCLDSFYFQYKLFAMEYENLNKFNSLIKNRTYCDYYKLYKLITKYINENKEELDIDLNHSLVPVYKDLEPFFDYGSENIKLVHENMLHCIKEMYNTVLKKESLIAEYTTKKKAGYSISNFVNTLNHENYILKSQIELYLNYISFFHISQQKQIKRLFETYVNFEKEINNNISSDHAFSFDDLIDNSTFEELDSTQTVFDIEKIKDDIPKKTIEEKISEDSEEKVEDNVMKVEESKEIPEFKGLEENNN
tara:strand:+ start:4407 stop:5318 length:912 start_codon:yes stop_codon:yes gene_type:complete